jgi:hypothetical protein
MTVRPEYDRDSKLIFKTSTKMINADLFAFKSQRFLPLSPSDSSYTISDPELAGCSTSAFEAWLSACHGDPFDASEATFRDILLFSKLWGTADVAADLCQKVSQGLSFESLLGLLKSAAAIDMPTDALEDRIRLGIGSELRAGGALLRSLSLPVLVRLLDVP